MLTGNVFPDFVAKSRENIQKKFLNNLRIFWQLQLLQLPMRAYRACRETPLHVSQKKELSVKQWKPA